MPRYADIDKLIEKLNSDGVSFDAHVNKFLLDAPAADVVEVRHGKWIERGVCYYECSKCGFKFSSGDPIEMFKYCRCGAKMDEKDGGENDR